MSRLGESNPRPTHYEYAEPRIHHALGVHPCTSECSPCAESDSSELHWRPRRRPQQRSKTGLGRNARPQPDLLDHGLGLSNQRIRSVLSESARRLGSHGCRLRAHLLGAALEWPVSGLPGGCPVGVFPILLTPI